MCTFFSLRLNSDVECKCLQPQFSPIMNEQIDRKDSSLKWPIMCWGGR